MRRMIAVLMPLAFVLVAAAARAPQTGAEKFSVLISYTPTGWSAHCEQGCASSWTASFSCASACNARVDAQGVVTLAEKRDSSSPFAFKVERKPDGVMATAMQGTAWTTLAWTCAHQPCRARITEQGVAVLGH